MRNLAHSANGRNPPKSDYEITKLKEEHQKEIQKLTYESKIELMESQMKIINLTHQLEIIKLKHSHEIETKHVVADRELQNKLTEMEKQLAIKDKEIAATKNEMTIKLNEKEKEIATKENERKMQLMAKDHEWVRNEKDFKLQIKDLEYDNQMKIKDLENEHKLKLLELTKERDATIRTLRNEIENLKTKKNVETQPMKAKDNQMQDVECKKVVPVKIEKPQRVFTKEEKFAWGPDTFFGGKKWLDNVYASYEDWYQGITLLLTNKIQENIYSGGTKYVFIKKEFNECHNHLFIGFRNVQHNYKKLGNGINIEGLGEPKNIGQVRHLLLHPTLSADCLQITPYTLEGLWIVREVTEHFYFGNTKSVIVLIKY